MKGINKKLAFVSRNFKRKWSVNGKMFSMTVISLAFIYSSVVVVPIRNIILYPLIECTWRDVETSDLLVIYFFGETVPDEVSKNFSCPVFLKPRVTKEDINASAIMTYSNLSFPEVLGNRHGWFLPALTLSQKVENLHLYKTAVAALDAVGVKHFLVDGSLLGALRHGGFIPWDDDIDVGVSIKDWEKTKRALSCIEGFTFYNPGYLHWKFLYRNRLYPYLDVFLYRMDESYVWAATPFVSKHFTYPKSSVFPLGESMFEGVKVPVPRDSLTIARRIFDSDICRYKEGHIKNDMRLTDQYPYGYSLTKVPCRSLSYMYQMYQLDELDGSCKLLL